MQTPKPAAVAIAQQRMPIRRPVRPALAVVQVVVRAARIAIPCVIVRQVLRAPNAPCASNGGQIDEDKSICCWGNIRRHGGVSRLCGMRADGNQLQRMHHISMQRRLLWYGNIRVKRLYGMSGQCNVRRWQRVNICVQPRVLQKRFILCALSVIWRCIRDNQVCGRDIYNRMLYAVRHGIFRHQWQRFLYRRLFLHKLI